MFSTETEAYKEIETHYRANRNNLVRQLTPKCRGRHNAEDVVQDTYMNTLRYWRTFDKEAGDFQTWFNTILNHCAGRFMLKEKLHGTVGDDLTMLIANSSEDNNAIARMELNDVLMLINTRRGQSRDILFEALIEQVPYDVLANKYNVQKATVEKTVQRFRILLKRL